MKEVSTNLVAALGAIIAFGSFMMDSIFMDPLTSIFVKVAAGIIYGTALYICLAFLSFWHYEEGTKCSTQMVNSNPLTFDEAKEQLKKGAIMRRDDWPAGSFAFYLSPYDIPDEQWYLRTQCGRKDFAEYVFDNTDKDHHWYKIPHANI